MKTDETLREAFSAALVLTGAIEAAECAVTHAAASLGPDLTREALRIETARAAVQQRKNFPQPAELPSTIPLELRALSLLSPACRDCFVLRVLMGLDSQVCSGILALSRDGVEEALQQSLRDFPRAVESVRSASMPVAGSPR